MEGRLVATGVIFAARFRHNQAYEFLVQTLPEIPKPCAIGIFSEMKLEISCPLFIEAVVHDCSVVHS